LVGKFDFCGVYDGVTVLVAVGVGVPPLIVLVGVTVLVAVGVVVTPVKIDGGVEVDVFVTVGVGVVNPVIQLSH
jgi:hypothetical protein